MDMRGLGRTHLWCTSYRAHGKRWVVKCMAANCLQSKISFYHQSSHRHIFSFSYSWIDSLLIWLRCLVFIQKMIWLMEFSMVLMRETRFIFKCLPRTFWFDPMREEKEIIVIWSRASTIISKMIDHTIAMTTRHNGEMVEGNLNLISSNFA